MIGNTLSYNDYVQGIPALTPEEQLNLIEILFDNLKNVVRGKPAVFRSKLAHLKRRKLIIGDADELVDAKVWEWNEQHNL